MVDINASARFDGANLMVVQPSARVRISGNLLGDTRLADHYSCDGTLSLDGAGTFVSPQYLEVMGRDLGTNTSGFTHNFVLEHSP